MPKAVQKAVQTAVAAQKPELNIRTCVLQSLHNPGVNKLIGRRCDFENVFDVLVGSPPDQKRFGLHYDLMTERSEYFAAARSGRWNEDDPSKPTDLSNEDPKVFADYVHTVYFNRVRVGGLELGDDKMFESNAAMEEEFAQTCDTTVEGVIYSLKINGRFLGLMKLYALANMLIDHKTANMIIDETIRTVDLTSTIPGCNAVQAMYSATVDDDGMRTLLSDYYAAHAKNEDMEKDKWPEDFMRDLTRALLDNKENGILKQRANFVPAFCTAGCLPGKWLPGNYKHRYYSSPGAECGKLSGSDEEDADYEPSSSEDDAVTTDDEMVE
jgi:hypothetical protein